MSTRNKTAVVSRDELAKIKTPKATKTWTPTPHHELVGLFEKELVASGYTITSERHETQKEGMRYFGCLVLGRTAVQTKIIGKLGDAMSLMVGVRNSHDRTISAGGLVGSHVFVCANGAFSGEEKFTRRHTRFVDRYLGDEIKTIVGRLVDRFAQQDGRLLKYANTELQQPNDFIVEMLDRGAIAGEDIPHVLREWRDPSHDEFKRDGMTVWRMFNAFTDLYKEVNVFDVPRRTEILHGIADRYAMVTA